MAKVLWGADLYKGAKLGKASQVNLHDIIPWQMLEQEEKTPEWLHAVADYYEAVGWRNVERRKDKIQRNYWLRHGKLNPSDYIINPTENQYYEAVGIALANDNNPLQQFYPIIPNIVDVLRGEFIKRNTTFQVEQIDPGAHVEALREKEEQFTEVMANWVQVQKQYELSKLGIVPDEGNEEMYLRYEQEMKKAQEQFQNVEAKFKTFRTTGAKWASKVVKVQETRYNLKELEVEGFESGLISDGEFWHLDMLDDTFRLELLNKKWCDYHKGPNKKYVSDGDYFLWFDWGSVGDIINTFGNKIKEEDFEKMKNIYSKVVGGMVVPDYMKSHPGSYYDHTKSWKHATDLNPAMNDAILGKEFAQAFSKGPNFDHNQDVDIFSPSTNNTFLGEPQMFRIMRLYFRSLKKIGWLTKIGRDGIVEYMDWVTEDFKVTIEPKYDNSIRKDKTKENLIYGEHVDWTWVNDWRGLIKISANTSHSFWSVNNEFESIYIDGGSCPFQFKGKDNPYESKPPVEGCDFSYINTTTHSLVDRLKPYQILHNIYMNKVPENALNDYGNKLAVDTRAINTFSASLEEGLDPINEYADRLRNSDILPHGVTREMMEGQGQAALPQVLSFSTADYAMKNLQISQYLKDLAGEVVGINRNRQGQSKASETATGVNSNITYSETQTEKYFEQHSNLMERVRQRMLDAAQYYSTFKDVSREMYLNEKEENIMLDMIGMENLFPHYNITLKSTANMRSIMQQLTSFLVQENTLPFKASSKIEALASESVNQMLNATKKAEAEAEQQEALKHQRDMELAQQQQQSAMEQLELQRQQRMEELEFNRGTQVEVATIRALGGVQTDANTNSTNDASENLSLYFKQQEIQNKSAANKDNMNLQKQMHNDKMILEREKNQTKLEADKVKADAQKYVARINK